ncbi:substrate-binding domain-containing protein [Paenibacillus sp. sgz302251]|uniref:substrate-binding domain-containing protein n=1 Tax=Paenibacillus sp. sgz302251 TaxID=3414493 RepID=UPI003C7E5EED
MSYRKWNIAIIILFIIFAYLLLSFIISTLRVQGLLQPDLAEYIKQAPIRHVVLISQELDNPYWRAIELGAREAADSYEIQLEYDGPFRINPDEQIRLLEKAIAAKADAIILQGINDPRYRVLIHEAVSQGIPVVTVDTDEPDSDRLTYVGTNNLEAGKQMGELIAEAADYQGQLAVLIGNEDAPNQLLRLNGLRSVIARYPNLTIVDVRSSNISRLQAAGQAEDILIHFPQVKYMAGLSALDGVGILEAAERSGANKLRIFAFDDLEDTLEGIREGKLEATIIQQPHEMGYQAMLQLQHYFQGNVLPAQHYTAATIMKQSTISIGTGEDAQ